MRTLTLGLLAATTALIAIPAQAVTIADGTASVSLTPPSVTIASPTSTYTPGAGSIFFGGNNAATMLGTGGFALATGQTGNMVGPINFSSTVGTTLAASLANFFVFNSSAGGVFRFSATSVRTDAYDTSSGGAVGTSNFSLYLLGTTLYDAPGTVNDLDPTATSLTLTFNQTGSSPYSASATLAVPPTGTVPEPASWALMLAGFGLMGYSMRSSRRKVAINFG